MSENELVDQLVAAGWRGSRDVALGPGDDAAVLRGGLVASADMMAEHVHFRFDWVSAREAGFRAGAAALSDMAAMGARPVALLVSMALPGDPAVGVELQRGVRRAGDRVGAPVAGGDVVRSADSVVVDVAALGRARQPVLRSGAAPGHDLWVSGPLGGAAAAVAAWRQGGEPTPAARDRFASPPNRVPLGRALAEEGLARSMIDVSDGLLADARRIAAASGVKIVVQEAAVPVDPATSGAPASGDPPPDHAGARDSKWALAQDSKCDLAQDWQCDLAQDLKWALTGGEDYELMFTAENAAAPRLQVLQEELSLSLTRIGTVERGLGVVLEGINGRREVAIGGGHDHFATPEGPGSRPFPARRHPSEGQL